MQEAQEKIISAYEKSFKDTEALMEVLEKAQLTHEKGDMGYETTKRLLESYRTLRFDIIAEKLMRDIEGYLGNDESASPSKDYDLDTILSMPENISFFSSDLWVTDILSAGKSR